MRDLQAHLGLDLDPPQSNECHNEMRRNLFASQGACLRFAKKKYRTSVDHDEERHTQMRCARIDLSIPASIY